GESTKQASSAPGEARDRLREPGPPRDRGQGTGGRERRASRSDPLAVLVSDGLAVHYCRGFPPSRPCPPSVGPALPFPPPPQPESRPCPGPAPRSSFPCSPPSAWRPWRRVDPAARE